MSAYIYIHLHTCWDQRLVQGSSLVIVLFIINTVSYACCGETCPWYAFRGQGITLWSWFSPFIFSGVLRVEFRSSDWWGNLLNLLRHLHPLLIFWDNVSHCAMHGLGKTGWPESPEASMCLPLQCWGCGCLFPEGSASWTQIPMLVWPSEPVP